MRRDKMVGLGLLGGGLSGTLLLAWLLFLSPWSYLVLTIVVFLGAAMALLFVALVGATLARHPPPRAEEIVAEEIATQTGTVEEPPER